MKPVVIYEWRSANPEAFQVYLVQAQSNAEGKSSSGNEIRLSNGASASIPISAAKTAEEWNVSMSLSVKDIQKPSKGDDTIYLFAGVQAYKSKTVKADIANLRIGTYNRAEGKVYDLDGTVMYDLKAMNAKEAENFYKYEDPFSFPKMEKKFAEGISWADAKKQLFEVMNNYLKPMRDKYNYYMEHFDEVENLLEKSENEIRPIARETIDRVRKAVGVI